ncbi:MAG: toll/interleukin-1 receptor domain-containing protein [Methanothrix sp.]|nr:toll/interleukin-1 receptor domain-containing protein [Methanothrix sp.]
MSSEFEYDVFLSYSSKDREIVHALAERLKQDGLRVWLDAWAIQPGDSIPLKGTGGTWPSSHFTIRPIF